MTKYQDLKVENCHHTESLIMTTIQYNRGIGQQKPFFIILLIPFMPQVKDVRQEPTGSVKFPLYTCSRIPVLFPGAVSGLVPDFSEI